MVVKAQRLVVGMVVVVVALMYETSALAQATVTEGETCTTRGNTAVSSTSGRALICTDLLDNGGGTDGLRWHVQTAANTPGASDTPTTEAAVTTTTAAPSTPSTSSTPSATTTPPTTVAPPMPTTGVNSVRWVGEGASLIGLGAALVLAGHRRRRGFARG
jgi:cytoskeletal protein RodZ